MDFSRNYFRASLIVGILLFLLFYFLALAINAREYIFSFFSSYEQYNVDEIFVALIITGLLSLAHSLIQIKKMSKEISRRLEAEKNVDWISSHDPITALPNQKILDSYIFRINEMNSDTNYAVFSIEIDKINDINYLLGYARHDEILKLIALRLLHLFPDNVYKLRGDEFLVLKSKKNNTDLLSLAGCIVRNICSPITINGFTFNIGANIGVARCPEDSGDLRKVIQQSHCALHVAKQIGKDSIKTYSPVMQNEMLAKVRLELEFKQALKNNVIKPYYQPLVDLHTNKIIGYEALARWESSPGNFVSPALFIALAEETGAIIELTEQLLRQACVDALTWPQSTHLSFNISPVQLCDKRFAIMIMSILDELALPPNRLKIEITETALFQDANAARSALKKLSDEGIKITLDDFGTGYSSLSQLCTFPFDGLKIDKSFIDTFLQNDKQDKIVRSIISMSDVLGLQVTAEGIEHFSQLQRLRELGCNVGQGYLLGKPERQEFRQKTAPSYLKNT